jgi:hypothetical protein
MFCGIILDFGLLGWLADFVSLTQLVDFSFFVCQLILYFWLNFLFFLSWPVFFILSLLIGILSTCELSNLFIMGQFKILFFILDLCEFCES